MSTTSGGLSIAERRRPVNNPDKFEPRPDPSLPDHLTGVAHPHQTAVCDHCGNYIFVTDDGVELGHVRKGDNATRSCPHRPECVEPSNPHKGDRR